MIECPPPPSPPAKSPDIASSSPSGRTTSPRRPSAKPRRLQLLHARLFSVRPHRGQSLLAAHAPGQGTRRDGHKARPPTRPGLVRPLRRHGANPDNIRFCMAAGLDYVSCSPYQVPLSITAVPRRRSKSEGRRKDLRPALGRKAEITQGNAQKSRPAPRTGRLLILFSTFNLQNRPG